MGGTVRCSRCGKGINLNEKWVSKDDETYHAKCLERIEKGRR